ncbi:DNA translocase SpoIIIE [Clostridiales bacterium]|nr:DNA translocase SpoIIIE [Clostridiales bacterium]
MAQKKAASGNRKSSGTKKPSGTKSGKKRSTSQQKGRSTSKTRNNSRSASRNNYDDNGMMEEIVCLIITAVSIVALISLFTEKIGVVGEIIRNVLKGSLGIGGYFLPFIVIAFCIWTLFSETRKNMGLKIAASAVFLVCLSSFAHSIGDPGQGLLTASKLYAEGSAANGGAIGGIIGGTLVKYLDKLGTYIILAVLLIASIVLGTGLSFFEGAETVARYVGDSGRRRDERQQVKAEKRRVKEEVREIRQVERTEKVKKRKEIFNILVDKKDFEPKETGGFLSGPELMDFKSDDSENNAEVFPGGVMPSDYLVRNIARHHGTSKPEINIKNDSEPSVIQFNKYKGIQCVISNDDLEIEEDEDREIEPVINMGSQGFELEEVSDEEMEEISFEPIEEELEDLNDEPESGTITFEGDTEIDETAHNYTDEEISVAIEKDRSIDSGIIGGEIYTEDEKKAVTGIDGTGHEEKEIQPIKTDYKFPPISILGKDPQVGASQSKTQMLETAKKLESTLKSFGVDAKVMQINQGPTVTRYEVSPSHGVKVSKIVNLADDIALNLAANGIRIEAPIPGKAAVGIEVPNKEQKSVYLRTVLESEQYKNFPSKLAFALGQDIAGNAVVTDIAKMPHLLIAGATGSGKSVCINTLITSIIYKAKPDEVKLILVDPKVVELSIYNGIPHLMIPVVTDPKKAAGALNWAVREMLSRYNSFAENSVRDIKGYNAMKAEKGETDLLPQIVIIIDELADLMMAAPKEVEDSIFRLAQMARAAGIHLIIATQRPSVDVITGVIKSNIPSRLAFAVSSGIDSRTILDSTGAEKLLGKGDMLFYPTGMSKPVRIQGAFVTDKEVENIVEFLRAQNNTTEYNESVMEEISSSVKAVGGEGDHDGLFEKAVQLVVSKEKASVSMLQRQFRIGYNRAARLMDELEEAGIVGPEDGSKPRKVLIDKAQLESE